MQSPLAAESTAPVYYVRSVNPVGPENGYNGGY